VETTQTCLSKLPLCKTHSITTTIDCHCGKLRYAYTIAGTEKFGNLLSYIPDSHDCQSLTETRVSNKLSAVQNTGEESKSVTFKTDKG